MVAHPQSKVVNCVDPNCYAFIIAGLCGLVIFVMCDTGAEMMMEVMVGIFLFCSKVLVYFHRTCWQWHLLRKQKQRVLNKEVIIYYIGNSNIKHVIHFFKWS